MKLVIEIDEELYGQLVELENPTYLAQCVINGRQLPKGHGRLIDADKLIKRMDKRIEEMGDDRSIYESSAVETALNIFAPTIIEADKECEE